MSGLVKSSVKIFLPENKSDILYNQLTVLDLGSWTTALYQPLCSMLEVNLTVCCWFCSTETV